MGPSPSGTIGGWLEAAPANGDATIYLDEEGKLKGLPFNQVATSLSSLFGDVIVGPAVVCGPPDEEGNDTNLPSQTEAYLLAASRTVCLDEGHVTGDDAEYVDGLWLTKCKRCTSTLMRDDEGGWEDWP
jgi:hypothetical protein